MTTEEKREFTKGPWTIRHTEIIGAEPVHTNGRLHYGGISSRSFSETVCTIYGDPELEFPKANARLIAASPEMFDLAKKAQEAMSLWTATYAPEFCDRAHVKEALDKLYAEGGTIAYIANLNAELLSLIAKVEGK